MELNNGYFSHALTMQQLTFKELQTAYKALTEENLQLAGGILNHVKSTYSRVISVDGVPYYHDEVVRGTWRYSLQGKSGDQDLQSTWNAGLLRPGRKIVIIQTLGKGKYILHGVHEYRGQLETLYHPGEDRVERKLYRAVLHRL